MSTLFCEPEVDNELIDLSTTSIFPDGAAENFINSPIDGFPSKSSIYESPQSALFAPPLHNYDQSRGTVEIYSNIGLEVSHIDSSAHIRIPHPKLPYQSNQFTFCHHRNMDKAAINAATSDESISHPPASANNLSAESKKRQSRKKKTPLPPAVAEKKRQLFLEKNRTAARKCRQKSRETWERVKEQREVLQETNKSLREECAQLVEEIGRLREWANEHLSCTVLWAQELSAGVDMGVDMDQMRGDDRKTRLGNGRRELGKDFPESPRGSGATPGGRERPQSEDDDLHTVPTHRKEVTKHYASTEPAHESLAISTNISNASPTSAERKAPSPANSANEVTSSENTNYSKVETMDFNELVLESEDETLLQDVNVLQFVGQELLPGSGTVIW